MSHIIALATGILIGSFLGSMTGILIVTALGY